MKYNFDEIIPRRGSASIKWDTAEDADILPMWVADMDFRVAPAIIDAITRRAAHGIFGYTKPLDSYYDAIVNWFRRKHRWNINKEAILCTIGVVPALTAIVKALTSPGDKVLIQTPVYNCFFTSIINNGCSFAASPLEYSNGRYGIDFDALERTASDPKVKLMLLCNPHNPAGRVWTREELMRIGEICLRHDITVIADELHCELAYGDNIYTPFASISDTFAAHSVTCVSPSKCFNIAGLQNASIIASDTEIRAKIDAALHANEIYNVNTFGVEATIAAYNEGEEWLTELREYIYGNYAYLKRWFHDHFPQYTVTELEGTYLVWVDCRASGKTSAELSKILLEKGKVWVVDGTTYGDAGEGFLRINIACPRAILDEGLRRIEQALQ